MWSNAKSSECLNKALGVVALVCTKSLEALSGFKPGHLNRMAVNLVGSITGQGTIQALSEIKQVASNGAIWGLYASNATSGLTSGGSLVIRPRANLSINLLHKIPKIAPVLKKAEKVGVKLSFGPTIVITFPLTLSIVRLTTEDGNYDVVSSSGGTFTFNNGPRATLPATVNEDLVDLLLRLVPTSVGPIKQSQILCLMSFDDPRVSQFLVAEFARSHDPATVLHLGKRLALVVGPEFFRPFLWSQNRAQALAAARHCSQGGLELSAKERLQVAIVLDEAFEPPPLVETTLEVWLEGLAGRDRIHVRRLAEQRGDEVLHLWSRFSDLAGEEQDWLVALSARLDPELLKGQFPELLRMPSVSLVIVEQAVQLGADLPADLLRSPHERVRATAIAAGLADDQLEAFLAPHVSALEAATAARRSGIGRLVELFGDARWEVRASAVDELTQRKNQDLPMDQIRKKCASSFLGEKVAAVDLLRRLGDVQWLEENLTPA